MEFRLITSEQDWSDAQTLRNRFHWNEPLSVEEMQSLHAQSVHSGRPDLRYLGIENITPKAYGGARQNAHSEGGKDYWLMVMVDPADPACVEHFKAMLDHSIEVARGFEAETVRFQARSEHPWSLSCLQALGFEQSTRMPVSALEINRTIVESPQLPSGHRIVSCSELRIEYPDTWEYECWRIEMDVAADLPLPFPFVESPFEEYRDELHDPLLSLDSQFVYLVGDKLAGVTQLHPSLVDPKLAVTGLTGTRREFRRQRVAMNLKKTSAAWAKAKGIELIFTDNEENNPMYQLNLKLGFEHRFDILVWSRTL